MRNSICNQKGSAQFDVQIVVVLIQNSIVKGSFHLLVLIEDVKSSKQIKEDYNPRWEECLVIDDRFINVKGNEMISRQQWRYGSRRTFNKSGTAKL